MQDPSTAFQQMKPQFPEQEQLKCPRCDSSNTKFCYYNNYNLSQPRHFCKNCRRYWTQGGALRNIPVGGGSRKNSKRSSSSKRSNSDPNVEPTRTNKRAPEAASSSSTSTTATTTTAATAATATSGSHLLGNGNSDWGDPTRMYGLEADQVRKVMDMSGSFSSLLTSNGQYGGIFDGLNPNGSGLKMFQIGGFGEDLNSVHNPGLDAHGSNNNDGDGSVGDGGRGGGGSGGENFLQSGEWGNSNGWPDLSIYTPSSSFQ